MSAGGIDITAQVRNLPLRLEDHLNLAKSSRWMINIQDEAMNALEERRGR